MIEIIIKEHEIFCKYDSKEISLNSITDSIVNKLNWLDINEEQELINFFAEINRVITNKIITVEFKKILIHNIKKYKLDE